MRRYRDAAFMVNHFDQAVALQHPPRQIESANDFVVNPEQQQVTEVGVGFNAFEDRNLKTLREFRIQSINFGIGRKQAMLSEANRVETAARALGEFEILLGRDVRVG